MTDKPISLGDLQLVKQALKDRKSEEILLRRVYPRIVQIVRMVSGNPSHVDDIAQIAALQVMKSMKSYRGEGNLEAWAGRIAYRSAMKYLKRQKHPAGAMMPILDNDFPDTETPEKSLSRRQMFELMVNKLDGMPEKRRVPFLLHQAYGYTVAEVSELTGIPHNTLKDRLKTAVREFKTIMDEHPSLMETMLEELQ